MNSALDAAIAAGDFERAGAEACEIESAVEFQRAIERIFYATRERLMNDEQQQTQDDRIAERIATRDISEKFLLGDLLKFMMQEIRQITKPFNELNQYDQEAIISRLTSRTRETVLQVVDIIIGKGRPAARATVESVTFKDGIKVALVMAKSEADRHAIADAQGTVITLVLPNYGQVTAGDRPQPEKDQQDLDLPPVIEQPDTASAVADVATAIEGAQGTILPVIPEEQANRAAPTP